tara:strand:+ start:240 stop:470 length:231 start_codon:yes stop_codon:yes gene_type:complete
MSTNNELLRKILRHPDLAGSFEMPKNINSLTISQARNSDDPYVSASAEILYDLGKTRNVNSTEIYTKVQRLLRTKL